MTDWQTNPLVENLFEEKQLFEETIVRPHIASAFYLGVIVNYRSSPSKNIVIKHSFTCLMASCKDIASCCRRKASTMVADLKHYDDDDNGDENVDDNNAKEDAADSHLLAPCQQLTSTFISGLLARLDRIHIP